MHWNYKIKLKNEELINNALRIFKLCAYVFFLFIFNKISFVISLFNSHEMEVCIKVMSL